MAVVLGGVEFLEYFPDAGSREQAAALHHRGEAVEYRVAVALAMAVLYGISLYRTMLNRARTGPATSKLGLAERSSS